MTPLSRTNNAHHLFSNNLFLASFLITLLVFMLNLFFFVPAFMTNDDVVCNWIASGTALCDEPSEHLVVTNILIGLLFKKLYTLSRSFPWYGASHFLVHFISMVFLFYALLYKNVSATRLSFCIVFLIGFELYLLNNLQFVITAFVAGQSGIFLFLISLKEKGVKGWVLLAISIALLFMGAMIRIDSLYLLAILSIPVFCQSVASHHETHHALFRGLLFVATTSVLVCVTEGYHAAYHNKSPCRQKDAFLEFTVRATDYDHIVYNNETKPIFDEVGWSGHDFQIFASWFVDGGKAPRIEDFQKIVSKFPHYNYDRNLLACGKMIVLILIFKTPFLLFMAFFFLLYVDQSRRRAIAAAYGTVILACILTFYLFITKKFPPPRVYYCMISQVLVVFLFLSEKEIQMTPKHKARIQGVLFSLTLIGLVLSIIQLYEQSKTNELMSEKLRQSITQLNPKKDELFVIWGANFPHTAILPFDSMYFLNDFKAIQIGWPLRTPMTKKRMGEHSINDLYRAIFEKKNISLIVRKKNYISAYRHFVRKHYGQKVRLGYYYKDKVLSVFRIDLEEGSF